MRSKIIDATTVSDERFTKIKALVRRIKRRHTYVQKATDLLTQDKGELINISKETFFSDLGAEVPEVYGNHDIHTEGGAVRVNFKVSAPAMTEYKEQPAKAYLEGEFGSHYPKLFEEIESQKLTADESAIKAQAGMTPELFGIRLKAGLTAAQLMQLVKQHPDMVSLSVPDIQKYSEAYPGSVETTISVKPAKGFLDKLADVPSVLVKQAHEFLEEMLKQNLAPAVMSGLASQKNKKSK